MSEKKHVFIIGSKGIPAQYGGFETFVDELVSRRQSGRICYHVSCCRDGWRDKKKESFFYHGARCFTIARWPVGPAKAIIYDRDSLHVCVRYIEKHRIKNPVVYVLACRIGPFIGYYRRRIERLGGVLMVNPDGHEWKRSKWSRMVRAYWRYSERRMVKNADLVICDSKNIQKYIDETYRCYQRPTVFLPYGADIRSQPENPEKTEEWLKKWGTAPGEYYLIVGRFVPENNYETMLREFMASHTEKKLLVITNVEKNKFYENLRESTHFDRDKRICFAGTVYDQELLSGIRHMAFAYLHGHEVGGTNPSLLEGLGATKLNLLYAVSFNQEVGKEGAFYWTKDKGSLSGLIAEMENLAPEEWEEKGRLAKQRIMEDYQWNDIVEKYEKIFLNFKKQER